VTSGAIKLYQRPINFYFFVIAIIPARYVLSVLGSIAMAIVYGLKVNLSVAMVAMVNHTAVKGLNPHQTPESMLIISNVTSIVEECEAENRTSSGVSQVSINEQLDHL
jgi:MFS transporter, ACS family, solute carrier family 17 (sodium-dependent inorganic phosphate cotransporter), other